MRYDAIKWYSDRVKTEHMWEIAKFRTESNETVKIFGFMTDIPGSIELSTFMQGGKIWFTWTCFTHVPLYKNDFCYTAWGRPISLSFSLTLLVLLVLAALFPPQPTFASIIFFCLVFKGLGRPLHPLLHSSFLPSWKKYIKRCVFLSRGLFLSFLRFPYLLLYFYENGVVGCKQTSGIDVWNRRGRFPWVISSVSLSFMSPDSLSLSFSFLCVS